MFRKHSEMWNGRLGRIAASERRPNIIPGGRPSHQMGIRQGPPVREETLMNVPEQLEAG